MKKETREAELLRSLAERVSWFKPELGCGSANELSPLLAGCPNELKVVVDRAREIVAELAQ